MSDRSARSAAGSLRARHELALDALYERKSDNKSVRVLTVLIYVLCVSLAAIILSLYYVFFWEPKDAQYAQRKVAHTVVKQTSTTPLPTCLLPYTGGSNTTMKESSEEPSLNSTNPYVTSTVTPAPVPPEPLVPRPGGTGAPADHSDVEALAANFDDHNYTTPLYNSNSSII